MLPWLSESSTESLTHKRDIPLAKLVKDEMLSLIMSGELAPGQRINEPDLAARMSVSRVPVREALRELESSGLIAARKHSGVFVRVLEPKEIADLYELRSALDGHAGRRVAQLGPAPRRKLVKQLEGLMQEMKQHTRRHDVPAYYAANLRFHWVLMEATDNTPLLETYRGIVQRLHLSRLKNLGRDLGMQVSTLEHAQIVEEVSGGDPDRCQAVMAAHATASHGRMVEQLDDAAS